MARGRILTIEQEEQVVVLYKQEFEIKEIMRRTGIKSEQTIYRILDRSNIPRRPKLKGVAPTSGMRHPKNFFKSNNGLM